MTSGYIYLYRITQAGFHVRYRIPNVESVNCAIDTGVNSFPIPTTGINSAILTKISGNILTYNISWVLKDMTVSTVYTGSSYGSLSEKTDSKTAADQYAYLFGTMQGTNATPTLKQNYVFPINMDDTCKLEFVNDGGTIDIQATGFVASATANKGKGEPVWRVDMKFVVGQNPVSLDEALKALSDSFDPEGT